MFSIIPHNFIFFFVSYVPVLLFSRFVAVTTSLLYYNGLRTYFLLIRLYFFPHPIAGCRENITSFFFNTFTSNIPLFFFVAICVVRWIWKNIFNGLSDYLCLCATVTACTCCDDCWGALEKKEAATVCNVLSKIILFCIKIDEKSCLYYGIKMIIMGLN